MPSRCLDSSAVPVEAPGTKRIAMEMGLSPASSHMSITRVNFARFGGELRAIVVQREDILGERVYGQICVTQRVTCSVF